MEVFLTRQAMKVFLTAALLVSKTINSTSPLRNNNVIHKLLLFFSAFLVLNLPSRDTQNLVDCREKKHELLENGDTFHLYEINDHGNSCILSPFAMGIGKLTQISLVELR